MSTTHLERDQFKTNGGEAPFETFRRYSAQPRQTAEMLASYINRELLGGEQSLDILDIGAGDGMFVKLLTDRLRGYGKSTPIHFWWLEPNTEYADYLALRGAMLTAPLSATVVNTSWEEYEAERQYDAILLSHVLYYFADENFIAPFEKMISHLKPGGRLFVVARTKDEDYHFLRLFFKRATGQPFNEKTIEDAEKALRQIREKQEGPHWKVERRYSRSHIVFPFATNETDAGNLVTFYLRFPWHEIDEEVREEIRKYITEKKYGQLQEIDCIIIVTRSTD